MLWHFQWFGFMFLFVACANDAKLLRVDDFKLRSADLASRDAFMVRGDQAHVLYGKLSAEERKEAIGHYITVRRKVENIKPATIRFYYQQVATGAEKLLKEKKLDVGEDKAKFRVIGEEYFTGGRILAWRVELIEDGKIIASEESFLW